MNQTYTAWLADQTPDRQRDSIEIMEICRRLGISQRCSPFSDKTEALRCQVAAYYRQYPE